MQLNINKTKIIVFALLIFSALFLGLFSYIFIGYIGHRYAYLVAVPVAFSFLLLFVYDKYLLFGIILATRSCVDAAFDSIKLGSFGLGAILNALVIIIALMNYFESKRKGPFVFTSLSTSWAIFLMLSLASTFYAPTTLASVKVFLQFVSYASMFYLGYAMTKTPEDLAKFMKLIMISGVIPLLYGIYSLIFGGRGAAHFAQEGLRVASTFNHPNPLSFYLVAVITATFYVYKAKIKFVSPTIIKWLPIYLIGLLLLLVMTKTRASWAACIMLLGLYALFYERRLLIYMFISCFLLLLIPEVQDRFLDLQKGNDHGASGYGRLNSWAWRKQYWHDALAWMEVSHYMFGYGLRSFMHYSTTFGAGNAFERQDIELNAHSVYVQFLFELGIAGLLSFLALIGLHIKKLLSLYRHNKLLVFTTVVLLFQYGIENITDNMMDYLSYVWYVWFMVGMSIGYIQHQIREAKLKAVSS